MARRLGLPDLGVGIGLRRPLHAALREGVRARAGEDPGPHEPSWLEVISENFLGEGGAPRASLAWFAERFPVVLHGVSLSLGGVDPLDGHLLAALRALAERTGSPWVSDHLCFSGAEGAHAHDLLPLPLTAQAARHVAARAAESQERIGRRLLVENVSSYLAYRASSLAEHDFVAEVAERADVGLLVDVNNVFVSARNLGLDPERYLRALPADRVVQLHVAGHADLGTHLLDTHSAPAVAEVWALYRLACELFGPVSTLIEWDDELPPLARVLAEVERARAIRDEVFGRDVVRPGAEPASIGSTYTIAKDVSQAPDSLAWLQRSFCAALRSAPSETGLTDTLAAELAPGGSLAPAERIDLYRRQYWLRHHDALAEDAPALARLLGDGGVSPGEPWSAGAGSFAALVRDYLLAHSPTHPDLGAVSWGLPAFVAAWPGLAQSPLHELALELATWECAVARLREAADEAPLAPGALATLPLLELVSRPLALRASLLLVRSSRGAALAEAALAEAPDAWDHALALREPSTPVALFRRGLAVEWEALDPLAARVLAALGAPVLDEARLRAWALEAHARGAWEAPAPRSLEEALSHVASQASSAELERLGSELAGWCRRFAELGWWVRMDAARASDEASVDPG